MADADGLRNAEVCLIVTWRREEGEKNCAWILFCFSCISTIMRDALNDLQPFIFVCLIRLTSVVIQEPWR